MIREFEGIFPQIDKSSYIDETAVIIGKVKIGKNCCILPGAVIRGDLQEITIGDNTNVQDNAVLHTGYTEKLTIGNNVTIAHNAVVHGCTVEDNCVIGISAVTMNGSVIKSNTIIGAATVITSRKVIPENSIVIGNPYKILRQASEDDIAYIERTAKEYVSLAEKLKK